MITIENIVVSRADILKQLKQLDLHKAAGPDKVYPRIRKEMADVLVEPPVTLF